MKTLLKTEELGLFLLSIYLFSHLPITWWVYPLLLLAPDFGIIGYLLGPRFGSIAYNTTHHKGLAAVIYIIGAVASAPAIALVGVIMLGHSSIDRVFGYGLKFGASFNHTHLGRIGRERRLEPEGR